MTLNIETAVPDPGSDPIQPADPATWQPSREWPSIVVLGQGGVEAEAIRGLRTRIMAQHVREGRRALAICTPTVDSGATFVASNLAVAMAQIGVKTALVDANLRTPSIARVFGLREDRLGLVDFLADETVRLHEIVNGELFPHLAVIGAGPPADNPQELLSSDRFRTLIDQLLREFDLTIIDTTPANSCTDAQRVATVAGYSLIVARKHKTYVGDVTTLAKLLRADRSMIVGTVLNDY